MAASGADRQWWVPLCVAAATLIAPLSVLAWQVALVLPARLPLPEVVAADPLVAAADPLVVAADEPTPNEAAAVAPTPHPVVTLAPAPIASVPLATPAATVPEAWTRESSFNFVVVGVDRRDEREIPRTDTILIGNVDLPSHRLSLVSVPRDLLVEIPGFGQDRINAAYVYGEQFGERDGGIGLLRRTIEWNFGVPIQHHGLVDFQCFRTAVDAIGGVTLDVPRPIVDPRYPTLDFGSKVVRFDAGVQHMNGERALEYARTRNPDNDFGRIRRQQQVVAGLRQQLLQPRSLTAMPTIMAGCQNMRSDLGFFDYLGLANSLRQFGDGDIALRLIDERMAFETVTRTGAEVLMPSWEPIRALVRDTFGLTHAAATGPNPIPPRRIPGADF